MISRPELVEHEAHAWWAWLDQPDETRERRAEALSEEERQRASRFVFERDRQRFLTGRGLLRVILGQYLGLEPLQVKLDYNARGKPVLAGPLAAEGLHFNLSHSGRLVVYAVARGLEIGVDVEELRPMPQAYSIARRFFAPGECQALESVAPGELVEAFFNCWTRKEAYIKASGEGLALVLERFEVELKPGAPARLLSIDNDVQAAARWSMHSWQPEPGYVAALALPEPGWSLLARPWPEGGLS